MLLLKKCGQRGRSKLDPMSWLKLELAQLKKYRPSHNYF